MYMQTYKTLYNISKFLLTV